jgi:hypothetical protein
MRAASRTGPNIDPNGSGKAAARFDAGPTPPARYRFVDGVLDYNQVETCTRSATFSNARKNGRRPKRAEMRSPTGPNASWRTYTFTYTV